MSTHPPSPHVFEVRGRWSPPAGSGEVDVGGPQSVSISVPAAFGGKLPGTNPEELLLSSALACYLMTLAGLLARRGLGDAPVEAAIAGEVLRTPAGLRFERIRLRPVVRGAGRSPEERNRLEAALRDAEEACFIARTLRPVIPYVLEPVFAD